MFNERTYPALIALFSELGVATCTSDMSFSVQCADPGSGRHVEWSGTSLSSVLSQRRNLLSPRFLGMLRDLGRFNRLTQSIAAAGQEQQLQQSLGDFLQQNRFGDAFIKWYFMPMVACIWSCPAQQMLQFPVATMIRFCHNHGLNQVSARPQWWSVKGGGNHHGGADTHAVCLHYLINRLQPLPWQQPVLVSLNPLREIRPEQVLGEYRYAHPVFDRVAIAAQTQVQHLQGQRSTYFCGAWMGYGFHEDGLKAGLAVAQQMLSGIDQRATRRVAA